MMSPLVHVNPFFRQAFERAPVQHGICKTVGHLRTCVELRESMPEDSALKIEVHPRKQKNY